MSGRSSDDEELSAAALAARLTLIERRLTDRLDDVSLRARRLEIYALQFRDIARLLRTAVRLADEIAGLDERKEST